MSKTYCFKTEQLLPTDLKTAWEFFSSAKNLARITPPEMDFVILSTIENKEIFDGMLIEYNIKPLLRIPMFWRTKIMKVNKPHSFTDVQLKGPYKMWEHTHTFVQHEKGVLMTDVVRYQLPLGVIGEWVHTVFIKKKIEGIFSFRKEALTKLFRINESGTH